MPIKYAIFILKSIHSVCFRIDVQNTNYLIPNQRRSSRSNCVGVDRRHLVNASAVALSPALGNSAITQALSRDWQLTGIVRAQSASYFEVTTGIDNALTGVLNQRPNVALTNVYAATPSVDGWFAPNAFTAPTGGTYGNLGAYSLRGPGRFTVDIGLARTFKLKESHALQIRGEAFNIQNRLNPANPVSAMNNVNFGKIQAASDPRIVQLAVKYSF